MTEIYSNEAGKSRIIEASCKKESSLRRKWFDDFELSLRRLHPDLMKRVKFVIVGSVAKQAASSSSDIDIVIQSKSSDTTLIPRVRNTIQSLLAEMKKNKGVTYEIDIQDVSNPLMFSGVANLMRRKK